MISLLLTLFISLFSICPAYYQVDQYENNNVHVKKVVENDISANERYRFYSINDLTSYDVMTNMWNYDMEHSRYFDNSASSYQFTFIPSDLNAYYIVDGGNTSHYDFTGFELKYRFNGCTFKWTENQYRVIMQSDFTICGLNNTTTLGHLHVNNVRYKFQGVLSSPVCSYFHDTNDTGLTLLLNNSFFIRCLQTNQSYNLYDFFGYGNVDFVNDDTAYQTGYDFGKQDGYREGKQDGYVEGFNAAESGDPVATSIISGIFDVGLLPVNVFLTIFNFELFGINIAGIVSGLLTLSVVIIVIRFLLGGKKDD